MKTSKKGELSPSFLKISIIVVTLLLIILSILCVRGLLNNRISAADSVFQKANTIISKSTFSQCPTTAEGSLVEVICKRGLRVPSQVELPQGSGKTFEIVVGHDGSLPGKADFDIVLAPVEPANFDERKVRAKVISDHPVTLKPDQQAAFVIQAVATTTAPISSGVNSPAYSITITANGEQYATSAFLITVTKPEGLF